MPRSLATRNAPPIPVGTDTMTRSAGESMSRAPSNAHSTGVTATRRAQARIMRLFMCDAISQSRDAITSPAARDAMSATSLMHIGISFPLRISVLASSWWQKKSPS